MTEYVGVTAGFNADTLPVYAKRSQRMVITARKQTLCPLLLVAGRLTFDVWICWNILLVSRPLTVFVFSEFKLRWRTHLWLPKHWQPGRSEHIRLTSRVTSQSSLTPTRISKHLWVWASFKEANPGVPPCSLTTSRRNCRQGFHLYATNPPRGACHVFTCLLTDVQRAGVGLPSGEREGGESAARRGASAHTVHGQDWRNSEPLQRWRHRLPTWVFALQTSVWCVRVCWIYVSTNPWLSSVIAARPSSIPYLSALLPSELELQALEETDSSEQDDQTDSENAAGNIITVSRHSWNQKGFCIITSTHFHLCFHQSFRTILEPTKRTPCFLPAALFPPQRPARTTWLTTRTSGRSRSPKSGGRNKPEEQTCFPSWSVLPALQSVISSWLSVDPAVCDGWDQSCCWLFVFRLTSTEDNIFLFGGGGGHFFQQALTLNCLSCDFVHPSKKNIQTVGVAPSFTLLTRLHVEPSKARKQIEKMNKNFLLKPPWWSGCTQQMLWSFFPHQVTWIVQKQQYRNRFSNLRLVSNHSLHNHLGNAKKFSLLQHN